MKQEVDQVLIEVTSLDVRWSKKDEFGVKSYQEATGTTEVGQGTIVLLF